MELLHEKKNNKKKGRKGEPSEILSALFKIQAFPERILSFVPIFFIRLEREKEKEKEREKEREKKERENNH